MAEMPGMRVEVAWGTPPLHRPAPNLLTVAQASLEPAGSDDAWDWPGAAVENLKERSDDVAADGAWSLKLTRDTGGSQTLVIGPSDTVNQPTVFDWGDGHVTTGVPAVAGVLYTATADVRAETADRFCYVQLAFFAGGSAVAAVDSPRLVDQSDDWVTLGVSAPAPAGATHVSMFVLVLQTAEGESHYVDRAGVIEDGAGWSLPGVRLWDRIDESDYPDEAACLRRIEVTRGARLKTAEVETGEAVLLLDNRQRALDPSNPDSPWAPVPLRRRIRVTATAPRDAVVPTEEWPFFGGHLNRLPTDWEHADGWTQLTAVDMLDLLATATLDSAFQRSLLGREVHPGPPELGFEASYRPPSPAHWWRLDEREGTRARDQLAGKDGSYIGSAQGGTSPLLPYEGGSGNEFRGNRALVTTPAGGTGRYVEVPNFVAGPLAVGVDVWARIETPPSPFEDTGIWVPLQFVDLGDTDGADVLDPQVPQLNIGVWHDDDPELHGKPYLRWYDPTQSPDTLLIQGRPEHPFVQDGRIHHIRAILTLEGSAGPGLQYWLIVDGHAVGFTAAGWTSPSLPSPVNLRIGAAGAVISNIDTPEDLRAWAGTATVAHISWWNGLSNPEWDSLRLTTRGHIGTGLAPWDGDLSGTRVHRVLDAVGVDPADRDIDPGTTVCGPAAWAGNTALEYLQRVTSTEQGALYAGAAHRIIFRPRPPNQPTVTVRYGGAPDPLDPDLVCYAEIAPEHSTDRLITAVEVSSDSLEHPVRVADPAAVAAYGADDGGRPIDTAARDASTLRSIGARLIIRNNTPRTVIDSIALTPRNPDVPADAALAPQPGDAVHVTATPTGPGPPLEQVSLIEQVSHSIDYQAEDWATGFGVAEHIVLPTFAWDEPTRGWDRSVWNPDT